MAAKKKAASPAGRASFPADALAHNLADFARPQGRDLLARAKTFFDWQDTRRRAGLWPYSRSLEGAPSTTAPVRTDAGIQGAGVNFGSQDYLSLASHESVRAAARQALEEFGPHSAGSPVLLGNTRLSLELERELAEFLQAPEIVLFPTGWAAGFGSIVGLVRPSDHIVMDQLAHACLQQGAFAATGRVHRHEHRNVGAAEKLLRQIRAEDSENGILVVSEGLFSMDSDTPDLVQLQEVCRAHGATLLVDVAHDLGALGPGGSGCLGQQELIGRVDLVMGSFSKTFASNGGFLATHSPAVKQFVKYYGGSHTFSNALSPLQAAVVLQCLRIVRSREGERLRASLFGAANSLRHAFEGRGFRCLGVPSAIVPVPVGDERVGRVASKLAFERGLLANLVEYPAVAVGAARFRLQVMAGHSREQTEEAARVLAEAIGEARALLGVT